MLGKFLVETTMKDDKALKAAAEKKIGEKERKDLMAALAADPFASTKIKSIRKAEQRAKMLATPAAFFNEISQQRMQNAGKAAIAAQARQADLIKLGYGLEEAKAMAKKTFDREYNSLEADLEAIYGKETLSKAAALAARKVGP